MYSIMLFLFFAPTYLFSMHEDGDLPNTKLGQLEWFKKESKRLEEIRKQNINSIFEKKTVFFCKKAVYCSNTLHEIIRSNRDPKIHEARIMEHGELLARVCDHLEQLYIQHCDVLNRKLLICIRAYWEFYERAYDKYCVLGHKRSQEVRRLILKRPRFFTTQEQ